MNTGQTEKLGLQGFRRLQLHKYRHLCAVFVGVGQTHRGLQGFRRLQLHIGLQWLTQTGRKQLDLLAFYQWVCAALEGQVLIRKFPYGAFLAKGDELTQGIATQRRTEPCIDQLHEAEP